MQYAEQPYDLDFLKNNDAWCCIKLPYQVLKKPIIKIAFFVNELKTYKCLKQATSKYHHQYLLRL